MFLLAITFPVILEAFDIERQSSGRQREWCEGICMKNFQRREVLTIYIYRLVLSMYLLVALIKKRKGKSSRRKGTGTYTPQPATTSWKHVKSADVLHTKKSDEVGGVLPPNYCPDFRLSKWEV
ncbi:hypothetical protein B0J14DRAFT_329717 [Halenospora varia]|nr:hypothetical protein B0J14DRAFT_329717 [Halenospora varia]